MTIILASASPRRAELLTQIGVSFVVFPSSINETLNPQLPIKEQLLSLALAKAQNVAQHFDEGIVLGADTVVVDKGEILGKPHDLSEARQMLRRLSGHTHLVMTAVALVNSSNGRIWQDIVVSQVQFRTLTEEDIESYLATGESLDKAGAYGIQGKGALLVESITGCYFNIVGLPLNKVAEGLKLMGVNVYRMIKNEEIYNLLLKRLATGDNIRDFSDHELLSLLLVNGTKKYSVEQISQLILTESHGLSGLSKLTLEELAAFEGIGQRKSVRILAALELGRRAHNNSKGENAVINSIGDIAHLLIQDMGRLEQEVLKICLLNNQHELLGIEMVAMGAANIISIYPKEILRIVFKKSAHAIILAHNHPSGYLEASNDDIIMTKRLKKIFDDIGIPILDHIIIGGNDYHSLKEAGIWE